MVDTKGQTVETYEASAEKIAKKFDEIGPRVDDVRRALSFVTAQSPHVVEIGCGNGRDAAEILKYTNHYTGFDISQEMIKLAREKVPGAHFEVADAETFAFPPGTDAVFSFASLLHSPKEVVAKVLGDVRSSLNDGGIVMLSLKEADEYREETVQDAFGTRTFYLYTPQLIRELAGEGYEAVYEDHQKMKAWDWFTMILRNRTTP